jgi:glyoxylate/hydroxypyruvate reductase A
MGLGELGRDAARKLAHIGFKVAGWSQSLKAEPGIDCYAGPRGLEAMLARTDILVALLPLTSATRGILNAGLFARLARDGRLGGPVLLNGGRGGLQVEADVVAALDSGVLAAASLDVFEEEPLPASSPLWRRANVYVSPHNAALSAPHAVARYVAAQITAAERGEPLRNLVERAREY